MVPFQDRPVDAEKPNNKDLTKNNDPKKRMTFFVDQQTKIIISKFHTHHQQTQLFAGVDLAKDMGIDLSVLEKVHEDRTPKKRQTRPAASRCVFFFGPIRKKDNNQRKIGGLDGHPHFFKVFKQGLNMS